MVYLIRYEEISVEFAVKLLNENEGWLDGDSRCVVCLNKNEVLLDIGETE